MLLGHIVKVQPAAVDRRHDALRAQDGAVVAGVERGERAADILLGEGVDRLLAPAGKDLVGVVVMVVAGALRIVALVIVVVVMMPVLVMIVVMMMVLVLLVLMVMVVMVVLVPLVVVVMVVIVVMMVMLMLVGLVLGADLLHQLVGEGDLLHRGEDGLAVQLVPGGGEDGGVLVVLAQERHGGGELLRADLLRAGEDDRAGGLDLVVIELSEVLHIDLHLRRVSHGDEAAELHVGLVLHGVLHGEDHVRELAHAGRLDEDAVGVELLFHVLERLAEVAHQRAADAPGGHLADLYAGLLQEAAVDADLAELVFDQHQLLALIGLLEQLLDERRLARAQKAGNNVNFCHGYDFLSLCMPQIHDFHPYYNSLFLKKSKSVTVNPL